MRGLHDHSPTSLVAVWPREAGRGDPLEMAVRTAECIVGVGVTRDIPNFTWRQIMRRHVALGLATIAVLAVTPVAPISLPGVCVISLRAFDSPRRPRTGDGQF